jgi:D-arabinose 1-dehydrogenase-like Zn-dependent alcohol dehydrogenase
VRKKSKYKPKGIRLDNLAYLIKGFEPLAKQPDAVELDTKNHSALAELAQGRGTKHHVDVVVAALRALDRGGTVAVNAIHLDRIPQFDYSHLWWERSVRSVANVTRADARDYLALAAEIPVRTTWEEHALPDANRALQRIASGEVEGAAVIVP